MSTTPYMIDSTPDMLAAELSPAPSLEARVAALEAALREKSRLVTEYALEADERHESRRRVRELEVKAANAKENANRAKKAYETALEDHLALEDSLATGQARLPLGDDELAAGDADPALVGIGGLDDDEPEAHDDDGGGIGPFNPPDEAWRAVPLCDLGGEPELAHGVVAALAEAGLATVGQLADWTFGGKVLTEVPGVGPAKADAIEAALDAFWRRRGAEQGLAVEAGLRPVPLADGLVTEHDEEPGEIEGDDEPFGGGDTEDE